VAKRYLHTCVRVLDEEKSVAFYEALGEFRTPQDP
jgi:catechol 2,3-dioxygenase-like lactoylglutathione lyase family enzyme